MNVNKWGTFSEKIIVICAYSILPLLLLAFLVILLSSFFLDGITTDINNVNSIVEVILGFSMPMIIGLIIIPFIFQRRVRKRTLSQLGLSLKKSPKSIVTLTLLVIAGVLISVIFIHHHELQLEGMILSFVVVAVTEEFYVRGVLYHELENYWNAKVAIFVSSFIFAFVYHAGADFMLNLLFRLPISIILALIRYKFNNIYYCSVVHYIYNLLVNF